MSDNKQSIRCNRHEPVLTNYAVDVVHDMVVEHPLLVVLTPLAILHQRLKRLKSIVGQRDTHV